MAFVIKEERPSRWWWIAIIIIILWGASSWYIYDYGQRQSNDNFDQAVSQQQLMQEELTGLQNVDGRFKAKISRLQRTAQVDREAKIELAKELKNLQDMQAELREEVAFYKSILSPDKDKTGLRVYNLSIMDAGSGLYHFKLVLTQSGKNDNLVKGSVTVLFNGVLQGKEKSLGFSKIKVADSPLLNYKFRYFQEISGSFRLPEGYSPRDIKVRILPAAGKRSNSIVSNFDWQKVRR